MSVGENIKRIRKEKGFTQKKLGELSGINEAQIRRYELGGKNANPKLETIEKIARALNVKITDLVESLYWTDYEKTEEYKELVKDSNSYEGIISILKAIYGDVTKQEYNYDSEDGSVHGTVYYYTIEKDENKFILHEDDIRTLLNYVKTSLPFMVDSLKDERSEEEIIKELCQKNEELMQKLINGTIKATKILD